MIRAIWFLLVALSTAFMQVQAVDVRFVPEESCDCCDQPGACGLPDCGLPPLAAPSPVSAQIAPVIAIKRTVAPRGLIRGDLYGQPSLCAPIPRTLAMGDVVAAAAIGPRYRVYCSFLI